MQLGHIISTLILSSTFPCLINLCSRLTNKIFNFVPLVLNCFYLFIYFFRKLNVIYIYIYLWSTRAREFRYPAELFLSQSNEKHRHEERANKGLRSDRPEAVLWIRPLREMLLLLLLPREKSQGINDASAAAAADPCDFLFLQFFFSTVLFLASNRHLVLFRCTTSICMLTAGNPFFIVSLVRWETRNVERIFREGCFLFFFVYRIRYYFFQIMLKLEDNLSYKCMYRDLMWRNKKTHRVKECSSRIDETLKNR